MGLDMELFKVKVPKGYTYKEARKYRNNIFFIDEYKEKQKIIQDFDKHYNEDRYGTLNNETPFQKKMRIKREMEEFLWNRQEEYELWNRLITKDIRKSMEKFEYESIGYWRKANHIHRWFVENVQFGQDDCREYEVTINQLWELNNVCLEVLSRIQSLLEKNGVQESLSNYLKGHMIHELDGFNAMEFEKILPTEPGFFFGSIEYSNNYFYYILHTIKMIMPLLSEKVEEGTIYVYSSCW